MTSQRARVGATALGAAGVAFGVIQLLQSTVSAFDQRPVLGLGSENHRLLARACGTRRPAPGTASASR
jgi:hypothetical protein